MTSVALTILYAAEPVIMVIAMIALLRSREQRRFPALFAYLSLRLGSSVLLHLLLQVHRFMAISEKTAYAWYFYAYWLSYIAGAIVVFLVIQEMFQSSMDPFPGLKWLGTISFRWVACISFVAAAAALLTPGNHGDKFLLAMVAQVMRCESIFILSLLLFLMLTAGKLGLSYRSRVFGISFGFGIMAAGDLVVSATFLHFKHNMMTSTISVVTTTASLLDAGGLVRILPAARAGSPGRRPQPLFTPGALERNRNFAGPECSPATGGRGSGQRLLPSGCRKGGRSYSDQELIARS